MFFDFLCASLEFSSYQNGGSCKATFSFLRCGMVEVLRVAIPMKERESLKIDVARIFGSNIGSNVLISNPFWSFPKAGNPASESSFSTWASMAATAKHVSEIPAFSYHPIHLSSIKHTRPPWLAAPMGSSLLASNRTSLPWRLGHPAESVSFVLQNMTPWRAFSNRLLRGFSLMKVSSIYFVETTDALWGFFCRFTSSLKYDCRFLWKQLRILQSTTLFDGIFFERHLDSDGFENTPQLHFLPGKCSFVRATSNPNESLWLE